MTLREVIDTICSKNEGISDIIENVLNMNMDQYTPRMMEFINQSVLDIQVMLKAFDKAITLCNRFDRKYVRARTITPDITKCMTEIKKINKRVGDMPVYLLIDEIVKHMDIDSVKEIYANDEDEFSSDRKSVV